MRISVIGAGYVGLTTAACLACCGHVVICVERDEKRLAVLAEGKAPFYEPGLDELVAEYSAIGRLSFCRDIASGIIGADMVFIAVGTPSGLDGRIDTLQVSKAAREISENMQGNPLIINRCTCPPGTCAEIKRIINERSPVSAVVLANPEFLREGTAINDFLNPDRIIIGADDPAEAAPLVDMYEQSGRPVIVMSTVSAELMKFAANAYLASSISFINGIAGICGETGADIKEIEAGLRADRRIGDKAMISAGAGYGGGCLPKDVSGLAALLEKNSPFKQMLDSVAAINKGQQQIVVDQARSAVGGFAGKKVAIWGLSFKPGSDDIRESAAVAVVKMILAEGAAVVAHDPKAYDNAAAEIPGLVIAQTSSDAAAGADILIVLTAWPEYLEQDLGAIAPTMASPVVIDARNLLDPAEMVKCGFRYYSIGRPPGEE